MDGPAAGEGREINMPQHNTKHGKTGSKVYEAWDAMMDRCYRGNHQYYSKYGGRGIKVCDRWHDFQNFYADMGDPEPHLSLDRINNDSDYTPENCRWATKREQSVNRSVTRWIELNGERLHLSGWAEKLGISREALHYRVKKFGAEKALTMPFGRWTKEAQT